MLNQKIFFKHHLGMGDAIVHNGMVRKYLKDHPATQIFIPSKFHNLKNVIYMYRDCPSISVLGFSGDKGMENYLKVAKFDKIISTHYSDNNPFDYDKYCDDLFYHIVEMSPAVKKTHFFVQRDSHIEAKVYDELVGSKGIIDYIFIHEKEGSSITINRDKLLPKLPIVIAESKYGIFELLKVIEMAKSVDLVSSCFLSLMTCKKYNERVFAHMYCDRQNLASYIIQQNIEVYL